jgi:hypothetical protein
MGQTIGPLVYAFGLSCVGKLATLFASASIMAALGLACALLLDPSKREEARA